jgi:hypothetical protein
MKKTARTGSVKSDRPDPPVSIEFFFSFSLSTAVSLVGQPSQLCVCGPVSFGIDPFRLLIFPPDFRIQFSTILAIQIPGDL